MNEKHQHPHVCYIEGCQHGNGRFSLYGKENTFILDSRNEGAVVREQPISGATGKHNNQLSPLIFTFFCAGGAEQYSGQRRTHQGRRSYSTGTYFHFPVFHSTFKPSYVEELTHLQAAGSIRMLHVTGRTWEKLPCFFFLCRANRLRSFQPLAREPLKGYPSCSGKHMYI